MRKVFPILAAAFVLMLCVVPAFAADDSGNPTFQVYDYKNASLPFDYVILNNGDRAGHIVNWPYNYWQPGVSYSFSDSYCTFWGGGSSDSFGASCVFGNSTSLSFVSSMLFFNDFVDCVISSEYDNVRFTNVSVCGYVQVPQQGSYFEEYTIIEYLFDHSRELAAGGASAIDLDGILRSSVNDIIDSDSLILPANGSVSLRNVIITVDFYIDTGVGASPVLFLSYPDRGYAGYNYLDLWLSGWELKTTVESPPVNVAVSDWLASSVGAFLSFEIAPGFSIDNIFWLAFILCFFLFFLKMLS